MRNRRGQTPNGGHPILAARGLSKSFGGAQALDDVSLSLEPGELTFLVGPSGAGKTTFLKLINRELRPTKGEVWVDGIPAHSMKASRVAELRRRVGVVFQDYKLLPRLTAKENVAFGLQVGDLRISDAEAMDRALDALEAVGLSRRAAANPYDLGFSQRKLLALASVLAMQTPVVILDEPTTAVPAFPTSCPADSSSAWPWPGR